LAYALKVPASSLGIPPGWNDTVTIMNMTTPTTSKIAEKRSNLRSIISSMEAIFFFFSEEKDALFNHL
jgi:hypothetical protein